ATRIEDVRRRGKKNAATRAFTAAPKRRFGTEKCISANDAVDRGLSGTRYAAGCRRIQSNRGKLHVMPIRPFPGKSRYHSQEFIGGAITSLDQGYLVANIDGGARGNPGPAGYGVVIEDEVGRPVAELSEFLGRQTNNYAEYSGLLAALNYTLRHGF